MCIMIKYTFICQIEFTCNHVPYSMGGLPQNFFIAVLSFEGQNLQKIKHTMLQQILKSRQLLEVKLNAEGIYYRDTPCPPKNQKTITTKTKTSKDLSVLLTVYLLKMCVMNSMITR